MKKLLAVDPGNDTGWAFFDEKGMVLDCGLGDPPFHRFRHVIEQVLIEKPQIYNSASSKADPNGLITLAVGVGRYIERAMEHSEVYVVLPNSWKGNVPKPIHNQRVLAKLTPADLPGSIALTNPGKRTHNIIDAVGLGKWWFTRSDFEKALYRFRG